MHVLLNLLKKYGLKMKFHAVNEHSVLDICPWYLCKRIYMALCCPAIFIMATVWERNVEVVTTIFSSRVESFLDNFCPLIMYSGPPVYQPSQQPARDPFLALPVVELHNNRHSCSLTIVLRTTPCLMPSAPPCGWSQNDIVCVFCHLKTNSPCCLHLESN